MRENVMYTVLGYIVFAIVFFPLLVFNHALWIGLVVFVTIIGSILFGQCVVKIKSLMIWITLKLQI